MRNTRLVELEHFARTALSAGEHPGDAHQFQILTCSDCGAMPQALMVEHHTGSTEYDFRGVIEGTCSECGNEAPLFRFTGDHRRPLRRDRIACPCGQTAFWAATCERIEGENGLPGFFDEGVVVIRCAHCNRQHIAIHYD